jgi:5-methylcytosine-specific restriction protein A
MFRQQRFFKGKYISLDKKIISYLEKYLENAEFIDDELYQDEIQAKEITGKEKLMNTFDVKPQWAETGGSMMVKKNAAYAKQALVNSNFLCEADSSHHTFMTSKGVPYMEGHHLIPCTAKNAKTFWKRVGKSIDCVENIVCLCPTCHRRIHFGSEAEKRSIIKLLYNKQHSKLKKAGLDISEKELIGLYLRQS